MTTLIDALDGACEHCATVIAGIDDAQHTLPTPCSEWDIRATIDHLIAETWMFTLVNEGQAVGEEARGLGGRDFVAALKDAVTKNAASWRTPGSFDGARTYPFGTFPADAAAMMNLTEVVVHTWDLAVALGADATIDPFAAAMLDNFYRPIDLEPSRAAGAYGAEVPIDPCAPPADRLLAKLGRRPVTP